MKRLKVLLPVLILVIVLIVILVIVCISMLPKKEQKFGGVSEPPQLSSVISDETSNDASSEIVDISTVSSIVESDGVSEAPASSAVEDNTPEQKAFEYSLYENGLSIDKYNGSDKNVVIPDTIDGLPVVIIGSRAFYECADIKTVTIPSSVTTIHDFAFSGCTGIEAITLPGGVKSVGYESFSNCSKLKTVVLQEGIETIHEEAFANCTSLAAVNLPKSLKTIKRGAFSECTSLTEIIISKNVSLIEPTAFIGCSNLEKLEVANGNRKYHSTGNCIVETLERKLVIGCKSSVIPSDGSVTAVDDAAFMECHGIESIYIPNGVKSIGRRAFMGCKNLKDVRIAGSVEAVGEWAFANCEELETVEIGYGVTYLKFYAFAGCTNLKSVSVPDTVVSIDGDVFNSANKLTITCSEGSAAEKYALEFGYSIRYTE